MREIDLVSIAGFLHDIGKFGQRADIYKQKSSIYNNKDYKYTHAAYTAQILNELAFNLGEEMSDNAAMHHNPQNDIQWIIASADRMASGFEREVFEEYNSKDSESYKQQRLWHIFDDNKQYKISPLNTDTIFAQNEKSVENEYNQLWQDFINDLKKIKQEGNSLIDFWTIDYILKKFTYFIPSSTSFQSGSYKAVKANIPLYEHSKTTAIFTSVLYKLYKNGNKNIINYYKKEQFDANQKDMLLISGDFFGIQNFIFDSVPTAKASKILRAKSAYIQLLTKIVAFYIVEELELSYMSIITTNAGKFEILAVNDESTKQKLVNIQKELNQFFIKNYFAETGIGVCATECGLFDFISTNEYKKFREKVSYNVEELKYKKFDLINQESILEIDKELNNQNLCPLCNKRKIINEYCQSCNKFVKIGEKLAKSDYIIITKDKTDIEIFKGFYIKFTNEAKIFKNLVAIYDISKDEEFKGYAKWELSSYVKTDEDGNIETFEDLAKESNINAIMALKGDVDFMGRFIKNSEVINSFAKFNFFSSMIDYFFSVYVPNLMQKEYKDSYTVFAGGDDLFVLGRWEEMIELAKRVHDDFAKFCENKMSFSVGMVMTKPNKPVNFIAEVAEEELENAKDYKKIQSFNEKEKNAIAMFRECVGWNIYKEMKKDMEVILKKEDKYPETFGMTFWYRILDFCDMRDNMDKDIKNALWKSKLAYMFKRNIIDKHKNEDFNEIIKILEENIEKYGSSFKIVLFEEIYKKRRTK